MGYPTNDGWFIYKSYGSKLLTHSCLPENGCNTLRSTECVYSEQMNPI